MTKWVSGWMSEWLSEWVSEWVDEWMSEWVSEWLGDWVSERWMSEQVSKGLELQSNWYQIPTQHNSHGWLVFLFAPCPPHLFICKSFHFQQWSLNTAMDNCRVVIFYSVGPRLPLILMETIVSFNWKLGESSLAIFLFSLYCLKDILFMDCKTIDSNLS